MSRDYETLKFEPTLISLRPYAKVVTSSVEAQIIQKQIFFHKALVIYL